jgi:transposase
VTRYRVYPTPEQEPSLLQHSSHARYVWNLAVEQHAWWHPGRTSVPGYLQLTAARADNPWLAAGSQTVQQQALRDFAQAMTGFFAGTHGRPSWRKAGRDEGFRIVGRRGRQWDVRRTGRHWGQVRIPKVGWVRFRWSRPVPDDVKSFRITRDQARRWHLAFAHIPDPVPAPGNGQVVGVDRGVAVSAALSTGKPLTVPGLSRGIRRSGWGLLARRLDDKAPGRVEKVDPAYTSQWCSACGQVDRKSRQSQAVFQCTACGYACNADVNAARNIAAGRAVTARGGHRDAGPVNREPQLLLQPV